MQKRGAIENMRDIYCGKLSASYQLKYEKIKKMELVRHFLASLLLIFICFSTASIISPYAAAWIVSQQPKKSTSVDFRNEVSTRIDKPSAMCDKGRYATRR